MYDPRGKILSTEEIDFNFQDITKEDFLDWLNLPVTKQFFECLNTAKHNAQVLMGQGETYSLDNPYMTHARTAQMYGYINGLNEALENIITELEPMPIEPDAISEESLEEEE